MHGKHCMIPWWTKLLFRLLEATKERVSRSVGCVGKTSVAARIMWSSDSESIGQESIKRKNAAGKMTELAPKDLNERVTEDLGASFDVPSFEKVSQFRAVPPLEEELARIEGETQAKLKSNLLMNRRAVSGRSKIKAILRRNLTQNRLSFELWTIGSNQRSSIMVLPNPAQHRASYSIVKLQHASPRTGLTSHSPPDILDPDSLLHSYLGRKPSIEFLADFSRRTKLTIVNKKFHHLDFERFMRKESISPWPGSAIMRFESSIAPEYAGRRMIHLRIVKVVKHANKRFSTPARRGVVHRRRRGCAVGARYRCQARRRG
ncbi:hypothetical protein B0H19DRAFT_1286350 [Mycena capillaripes]|nr:hypothetical protein B0H19DRAFT_1286350 [Mycena capillaripes]